MLRVCSPLQHVRVDTDPCVLEYMYMYSGYLEYPDPIGHGRYLEVTGCSG